MHMAARLSERRAWCVSRVSVKMRSFLPGKACIARVIHPSFFETPGLHNQHP